MPWCPKCKNEYKEGYSVCADCGCSLVDELGEEIIAYFGSEKEVDNLLTYLEDNGYDFAYKRYSSKEGHYQILIQENKKELIRKAMQNYFSNVYVNETPADNYDVSGSFIDEEDNVPIKRYKKPAERAAEYKAGFQTMFLVGGVGIVVLILIDLGIIPIYFAKESKILINIVMGGMFVAFLALGINSLNTYKKLIVQTDEDAEMEKTITKWFSESVTVDMLTSNENKKEAEEILYFNRYKSIKRLIKNNYPDLEPSFLEYLTDKMYNDLFN